MDRKREGKPPSCIDGMIFVSTKPIGARETARKREHRQVSFNARKRKENGGKKLQKRYVRKGTIQNNDNE